MMPTLFKAVMERVEGFKIMIVDDDPTSLAMYRGALGLVTEAVVAFSDPEVALKYAGANRVDIVVTDLIMPGISGIELAARMKNICPEICLIALTSSVDVKHLQGWIATGGGQYLVKPISACGLYDAILSASEKIPGRRW